MKTNLKTIDSTLNSDKDIFITLDSSMISSLNFISIWQNYYDRNNQGNEQDTHSRFIDSILDSFSLKEYMLTIENPSIPSWLYYEPENTKMYHFQFLIEESEEQFKFVLSEGYKNQPKPHPEKLIKDTLRDYIGQFLNFFNEITKPNVSERKLEQLLELDFETNIKEVKKRFMKSGLPLLPIFSYINRNPENTLILKDAKTVDDVQYGFTTLKY
ncbi:MAG: hypothetical protein PF569_00435 [Candidatus Woesearchaeota archaeon]|jgi:hypothetical protein|nr:hypothetical protein [Candidatus Woesearchaeota archaeon]